MEESALCPPVASECACGHTGARAHVHTLRAKIPQRWLGCVGCADHLRLSENERWGMVVKSGAKENCSVANFGRILFFSSLHTFVRTLSRYHVWNFFSFFKKTCILKSMFHGSQLEILKPVCSVGFHPGSHCGYSVAVQERPHCRLGLHVSPLVAVRQVAFLYQMHSPGLTML